MKIRAELELELMLPDTDEEPEDLVTAFLNKSAKVPLGLFLGRIKVVGAKKVQPWEDTMSRFS